MRELIKTWVRMNYGDAEAENPSWDIDSLATFLEKDLGMDLESKKKRLKDCFMENLNVWQRVNTVTGLCRELIYDKNGKFLNDGCELRDYLCRLDKKAREIEQREPDYSELDEVE